MRPDATRALSQTGAAAAARRVLVVDDSRAQRRVLALTLERSGYRVTEAASAEEGLALCRAAEFDIVISDWMMPGMSGVDFCRAFRALPRDTYGCFFLLTSRSEKAEVADGLDAGADDFLAKPVNPDELRARLRAGERIIAMQGELVRKNVLVGEAYAQLQAVYDSLDRDLIEARKVQQTLVRDRHRVLPEGQVTLMLRPSGHVGGDLVGSFDIGPGRIALFSVDVSGHGVASAMMTARLSGLLSGAAPERNVALVAHSRGPDAWPPEIVASRFNRLMLEEFQVDLYFTMAYAEIDLATGRLRLVQAGHPHPVILRSDGTVEPLGEGGLPIGLIPAAPYDRVEAQLRPGDRLFLLSDGVTECAAPDGTEYGASRLAAFLTGHAHLPNGALLEALAWSLTDHCGRSVFQDDVSGVLFAYRPWPEVSAPR
jgi:sigma-B regulation protein RsbU (phosphoserine phosphatase)